VAAILNLILPQEMEREENKVMDNDSPDRSGNLESQDNHGQVAMH
jgi:hypothetical protein